MQFWFGVIAGLFTGWILDFFVDWRQHVVRRPSTSAQPLEPSAAQTPDSFTSQYDDKPSQESNGESNT